MTPPDKPDPPSDAPSLSLKRWSQRKHAVRREAERVADSTSPASVSPGVGQPEASAVDAGAAASLVRSDSAAVSPQPKTGGQEPNASPKARGMTAPAAAAGADPAPLPPVHTLTPKSDFTRFFDAKAPVDDALKRAALKALLRDPRFNVMDGLDTYVGDYTRSDPIPEAVLQRLVHAQSFLTPSPTPEADSAQTSVDAALAAQTESLPPPTVSPAAAPEPAAPASVAKATDAAADDGKPTT